MKSDDTGKLILRLCLGILILMHGLSKLANGVGFIANTLVAQGLPGFVAYFVLVGEVLAPVLLILGLFARLGGLIVFINMVVAILLMHMGQLGSLNNTGGWALELQGMFLFGALAMFFLGAGRFSLGGVNGRWN